MKMAIPPEKSFTHNLNKYNLKTKYAMHVSNQISLPTAERKIKHWSLADID